MLNKYAEIKELKIKDNTTLSRNHSMVGNNFEKILNEDKKKIFPPHGKKINNSNLAIPMLQKSNSGKLLTIPVKNYTNQVKSLSPEVIEVNENTYVKERPQGLLNIKLDITNKSLCKKPRHFSNLFNSEIEKNILEKMIIIEKEYSNENNQKKLRIYLNLFDDICNNISIYDNILKKFKTIFEEIFYKNISLLKEVENLKAIIKEKLQETTNEKNKSFLVYETENKYDKSIICNEKYLQNPALAKKKKYKNNKIKNEESLMVKICSNELKENKSKEPEEKSKIFEKIPRLSVYENITKKNNSSEIKGFHQEFMSNANNFSESWRKMLENDKKF